VLVPEALRFSHLIQIRIEKAFLKAISPPFKSHLTVMRTALSLCQALFASQAAK
jgi:hypothetical protein